jgi:Dyp-type peroxidase family
MATPSRATAAAGSETAVRPSPLRCPFHLSPEPLREAPAPEPLQGSLDDPSHPDASREPVLNVENIQGNILVGFNKDHQAFLFLSLDADKIADFKGWLQAMRPFIATTAEVLAFNRLFKAIRARRQSEPTGVKATWLNIAFSYAGLHKLIPDSLAAEDFEDEAFREGLAARSTAGILGDPSREDQTDAEGHPDNWVLGGTQEVIDVVVLVASDDESELDESAPGSLLAQLLNGSSTFPGGLTAFGTVKVQQGQNLPADQNLAGHEHFGFLDGVSQPGVRGRLSHDSHDVLTPRQNANDRDQGKPGQELIWPGEFVFGYPQGPSNPDGEGDAFQDPGSIATAGPDWANDGAFLVFRRLRQDVGTFHQFLKDTADALGVTAPPALAVGPPPGTPVGDSAADVVGARLVGRWRSGAPVMRTRHPEVQPDGMPDAADAVKNDQDNPFLATDDCANNNFEFFEENVEPLPHSALQNPFDCIDAHDPEFQGTDPKERRAFQSAHIDPDGAVCPFTAHIRKAYPRDDQPQQEGIALQRDGQPVQNEEGEEIVTNENDTQTHRILRRGIPFGAASDSTPNYPIRDVRDERPEDTELTSGRGLLFLAYQTSIVEQFEFITQTWVNNPDFKEPKGPPPTDPPTPLGDIKDQGGGHDPIIGQNNTPGEDRVRTFTVTLQDPNTDARSAVRVSTAGIANVENRDWVIPTGGEYFFAPSIDALQMLAETDT